MEIFLNIIVNLTCIFTSIWCISNIMRLKKNFIVLRISAVLILAVIQTFVCVLDIALLNTLSSFFMIIFTIIIFADCKRINFLIYSIMTTISAFAADIVATLCLSVIYDNTISSTLQQKNMIIARYILTCILTFVFCNIAFSFIKKNDVTATWYEVIFYIILATGEALTSAYIVRNIQETSSGKFMIAFLIGCFILDLYIVLAFYQIAKAKKTEKENALLRQQSNQQISVYRDLQIRYERSMKIIHDIKKHVNALEELIETKNMQAAENYKKSLYKELDKIHPSFKCDNQLLSVIINHTLLKAEQKNIHVKLKIEETDLSYLSDIDMTTIISNILDNALEAAAEVPPDEREILIITEKKMGCYIIHIENTFDHVSYLTENKFFSTKHGHMGIGLKNVEDTVKKYNGMFSVKTENNKFITLVTIPEKT